MNTARLTNAEIRARGGMRSWRAWGLPELSASRCRPSGAPATMPLDATGCSAGSRWTSCWRGCGHPLRAPGAIGAGRERSPRRLAHPGQAGTVVMIHGGPVVQGALAGKRRAAEPRTFCEESKRSRPSEAPRAVRRRRPDRSHVLAARPRAAPVADHQPSRTAGDTTRHGRVSRISLPRVGSRSTRKTSPRRPPTGATMSSPHRRSPSASALRGADPRPGAAAASPPRPTRPAAAARSG